MRARWLIALAAAALLLAACGGGDDGETGSAGNGDMQMDEGMGSMDGQGMSDEIDFGRPGDPGEADRKIRIEALDSLEFEPARIEVEDGEVVTFVVKNVGKTVHEFTLGDEDFQMAHEEEMSMDGMGEDKSYSVTLDPGEPKELTWVFSQSGEVRYGCHEPGHYEGGMVGTIMVE
jgi:uncharacterized cupredoxin-like copper-binding protein